MKLIIVTLIVTSCAQGTHFNPDFYAADSKTTSITSEVGDSIQSSDPRFDSYACLSYTKIEELRNLLLQCTVK